ATIKVYDSKSGELIGVYNSNSATGKYIIIFMEGRDYLMTVEAENYKMDYEDIDITYDQGFEEKNKNIKMVPNQ
ncbi:MAG: hypothetical protein K2X86_13555, partial [Cytophagaceae bacterium]|nr:hypothetical protein [Cytophagaceae bacterium]